MLTMRRAMRTRPFLTLGVSLIAAAAQTVPKAKHDAFQHHLIDQILSDPMTLYGAGDNPKELRQWIETALRFATGNGAKIK
jgi:hypothetical protein